ncbi:MAG: Smr/MutS family protein [Cyclobacteriaceae bacterium]
MKLFPKDIEGNLGFVEIRELLQKSCQSLRGEALAGKCSPSDKVALVSKWHSQTREMLRLLGEDKSKVELRFPDIDEYLIKVKIPGSWLDPADFHELKIGVSTLSSWALFFSQHQEDYPELSALSSNFSIDSSLTPIINKAIDEKGAVRDSASQQLLEIRTQISKSERAVRSAIQKVLKKAKTDQFTEEDSSLTVRDGRLVIPLKAEFKKRIPGFVHDESATGQTVFIEPGEVLDLNNEVRELQYAENREVIRILVGLSDLVRENLDNLKKGTGLLEKLDFIYAKTKLAELLNAIVPSFTKETEFSLINAIHPLLYLTHKGSGKQVVPLTISLRAEQRILIISGPNAGGKSVALKTVGLIQYMFQCGLPVPVSEESSLGFFTNLFLDIGDAQSIEDDLSTYSSHLTSMKHFLKFSDKKTLFLIDEFGKGTEPQFGGAIAESVLREINKKGALGIVTTHYQNLKNMGEKEQGVVNGAMKYNLEALEPLFELEIGKPGSSFAFEIAAKIGLPDAIITAAKSKIGRSQVDYDQLLNQLEREKAKFERLTGKLDTDKKNLIKVRSEYEDVRKMLDVERKQILKDAKQEASRILKEANKDVERVIREIQESKASKEKVKKLRDELELKKGKLGEEAILVSKKPQATRGKLKVGDSVKMIGQDTVGVVRKVKGKQAEVSFGSLKSIVSIEKLEKTEANQKQQQHQRRVRKLGIDVSSKIASFNHELSLLGMRADEALGKIASYLDEALLVGAEEVRIVHGKGHGVLREIVRNYAKDHPSVQSISNEHADRGGDGISIISLK